MKYISIDLETTGLDANRHQILEFGAVIEDTDTPIALGDLPSFHAYLLWDEVIGDPFALAMNYKILSIISDNKQWKDHNIITPDNLGPLFKKFIDENFSGFTTSYDKKVTVAGKNFGNFDNQFLKNLPNFFEHVSFEHRFLDPGSIFFDPTQDKKLPGLDTCLERVGVRKSVAHTAVEDAKDVILALRGKLQYHKQYENELEMLLDVFDQDKMTDAPKKIGL